MESFVAHCMEVKISAAVALYILTKSGTDNVPLEYDFSKVMIPVFENVGGTRDEPEKINNTVSARTLMKNHHKPD